MRARAFFTRALFAYNNDDDDERTCAGFDAAACKASLCCSKAAHFQVQWQQTGRTGTSKKQEANPSA